MYVKIAGQLGSKGLGKVSDGGVEVENSGVLQALGLIDNSLHHVRVAVATTHRSYSSKTVQVSPAFIVEQVLPLPVYHVQLPNHTYKFN